MAVSKTLDITSRIVNAVRCPAALQVPEVATAMCDDLAMLAGAFLISSSRWNQELPADECICRLSEVGTEAYKCSICTYHLGSAGGGVPAVVPICCVSVLWC